MAKMREQRSRAYAMGGRFDYLPEDDRFLMARPEPRYRFNVIGTGINGQEHIAVTMLEGQAAIHGIYDPNPRSIAAAQKVYKLFDEDRELVVYSSLAAACNDPKVDGLIICTPNYTHLNIARAAVQSGKHILLEKPMATTVGDAHAILQLADAYESVFQIGLQYRYKSIYREALHEAFERRSLGTLHTISILEHRFPFLDKVNQWNKFAEFSGDTLVEKCCHYFDLFNLFAAARPVRVFASGSMAVNFRDFEYDGMPSDILDNALVIVEYANGIRANFNLCMFAPMYYEELILCGEDGRLKAWEHKDFLPEGDHGSHLEISFGEEKPSRRTAVNYPSIIERSGHNGATFFEHVNFVARIDGKASNAATAREGFWSIVVAAAAQASIKTGNPVMIDEFLAANGVPLDV